MKHKVVKKVLMCRPLYFSSLNYAINPWMEPGTIDQEKTLTQWDQLVAIYKNLGITVEIIEPAKGSPDMVFAADQGLVYGQKVLLSRFRYEERRAESTHYEKWFRENNYTIEYLPENYYFEANGEAYFWNDLLFVSTGFRTDKITCQFLSKFFDREVIPIQIVNPAFYHLDIGFFPLNSQTVFYYPSAYTAETSKVLIKRIPNLIPLTQQEAFNFAGNNVVTGHHVIHQAGNPSFQKKLQELGYTGVEVELGEFKKSGGGAHCLTNILEEIVVSNELITSLHPWMGVHSWPS